MDRLRIGCADLGDDGFLIKIVVVISLMREVAEACEVRIEMQAHRADRAVTRLGDDAFADIHRFIAALLPFHMFLGAGLGLGAA